MDCSAASFGVTPGVLFISHSAEISGPTHSLCLLASELHTRYRVGVLAPERGPLSDMLEPVGVQYHVLPHVGVRSVPAIARIVRALRYDLVYGNNPSRISRNALVAAKLTGRSFVWHFRGMKQHWGWKRGVFLRWADGVVAVSEACAEPLRRFRPQDDIVVVHNGVEPENFLVDRADAREALTRELSISPDATLILTASHLIPRKGIDLGLSAFQSAAGSDAHWIIAGSLTRDPDFAQRFREQVRLAGLESRVHLLGLRSDMPRLLRAADVFLHPALRDPHPRAVLEAMAAELPVVAFDVDGIAETVVAGRTGYLAPLGDASGLGANLQRLLGDRATQSEFGKLGSIRIRERFTATHTAEAVSHVIDSCLRRRKKAVQ
jgi:glycosyltransferase involved in cell wall biosynthesis